MKRRSYKDLEAMYEQMSKERWLLIFALNDTINKVAPDALTVVRAGKAVYSACLRRALGPEGGYVVVTFRSGEVKSQKPSTTVHLLDDMLGSAWAWSNPMRIIADRLRVERSRLYQKERKEVSENADPKALDGRAMA